MPNITQESLIKAVFAVLNKRGDDYIYRLEDRPNDWTDPAVRELGEDTAEVSCKYSDDEGDTGSCLFGSALIDELHVVYESSWEGDRLRSVLSDLGVTRVVAETVLQRLDYAQRMQDRGNTYGEVRRFVESWASQDGTVIA